MSIICKCQFKLMCRTLRLPRLDQHNRKLCPTHFMRIIRRMDFVCTFISICIHNARAIFSQGLKSLFPGAKHRYRMPRLTQTRREQSVPTRPYQLIKYLVSFYFLMSLRAVLPWHCPPGQVWRSNLKMVQEIASSERASSSQ